MSSSSPIPHSPDALAVTDGVAKTRIVEAAVIVGVAATGLIMAICILVHRRKNKKDAASDPRLPA